MADQLNLPKTQAFRFGHLSDLHFSEGTDKSAISHSHSIPLLQQLQALVESKPGVDKYFITGDISNHGDRESLLRAKDWIFDKFSVGGGEQTGLNLRYESVGIVPGNHDAWNADSPGTLFDRRQQSLENFNFAFDQHVMPANPGCYYEWIEKGGFGIFVVYLDSCILGDHAKRGDPAQRIPYASKVAKGRVTLEQTERILQWVDDGCFGHLVDPTSTEKIAPAIFRHALKIIVTHHYLFEPAGLDDDYFM